jgi:DNA topoisomerase IB
MRLRRTDLDRPGYGRRPRGRGFAYLDADGAPLTDDEIARVQALVIPPAWTDVWINPDPRGHIQAVGTDAAGRRQYRYHDAWRVRRDAAKFTRVLHVATRLPRLRRQLSTHLHGRGLTRTRVLATATRLLDLGAFRAGGDEYAREDDPSGLATFGLATLRRDHVEVRGERMTFCYPAKGGVSREVTLADELTAPVVRALASRRRAGERLFAYWSRPRWREVHSGDVNEYLRDVAGCDVTAKDFRTWHATVAAAAVLAASGPPPRSPTRRRRTVAAAMRSVADLLGNTPSVARASYVDPHVLDLYARGELAGLVGGVELPDEPRAPVIPPATERAVLRLLRAVRTDP